MSLSLRMLEVFSFSGCVIIYGGRARMDGRKFVASRDRWGRRLAPVRFCVYFNDKVCYQIVVGSLSSLSISEEEWSMNLVRLAAVAAMVCVIAAPCHAQLVID